MASGPLEKDVQATFVDLARVLGWRAYHTFDSRHSAGGFPDLVLVRERVVYAELKRVGEVPRADQVDWLRAIAAAGGEAYLWTIDDLGEAADVLGSRAPAAPRASSSRLVPDGQGAS